MVKAKLVCESNIFKSKSDEDVNKITKSIKSEEMYNLIGQAISNGNLELAEQYLKLKKINVWQYVKLLNHWEHQVKILTKDVEKYKDKPNTLYHQEHQVKIFANTLHNNPWKNILIRYQKNVDLIKKYAPEKLRSKIKKWFKR